MPSSKFLQCFDSISTVIPFNPAWKNNTGYFDHAVQGDNMPAIPTGMTVKSEDDIGRKIIITSVTGKEEDGDMVGKQVSCVVIFERYSSDDSKHIIVSNASRNMASKYPFLASGRISEEDFASFHHR